MLAILLTQCYRFAMLAFCYHLYGEIMHKDTQMNIRVPIDIKNWAKKSAKANRRSLTSLIVVALEELRKKEEYQLRQEKNMS